MLQYFLIFLAVVIVLVGVVTLGFAIPPRPYRPHLARSSPGEPRPLPLDLPTPVRRHFIEMSGETLPEMQTAVIWGRGRAKIRGVWLPLRFKTWYQVGRGFYTRMEITWFLRPVMRSIESYRDGQGMRSVGGNEERGPHIDQANRMLLWANSLWMPAALVQEPNARWEPVDEVTARLVFREGQEQDSLLFHFDPLNGCVTHITGSRYGTDLREDADEPGGEDRRPEKEDWRMDLLAWKVFQDLNLPCHTSVSWGEAGSPWSYWNVDGVVYNVSVADHLP